MFKTVGNRVWAFDAEWVPDPQAGRLLYDIPAQASDREVIEEMWKQGGANEENPTPYLKTILCRLVSISMVERKVLPNNEVALSLLSLPKDITDSSQIVEEHIISTFLQAIGKHKPQLVGFNSGNADLRILIQRGIVNGISAPSFCERPNKPWEGVDYFAKGTEAHVDLKEIVAGWGQSSFSLNEIAKLSGIPGKLGTDGEQVAELWLAGKLKEIVDYNECDALTTYLVWLRTAYFGGHFTTEEYTAECQKVRELIELLIGSPQHAHLKAFLKEWDRLRRPQ